MSQKKIKITVQRGEDGEPGVVEYDEFVLIGWDKNEDGSSQTFTQSSALPGEEGEHLLLSAKAIARAMKKHPNPAAQAIGTIMENTIQSGLDHLQRAMEADAGSDPKVN
jgi:hypothetical protein